MEREKVVFITGATGFLGCHLAYEYLTQGHTVIALIREKQGDPTSIYRVEDVLRQVGPQIESHLGKLRIVRGDVQDTAATLIARVREVEKRPLDEVWHCVATFKFHESEREEIIATNIEGTKHILQFVSGINQDPPPRYFHVSTAYSSGRKAGNVPEEILDTHNQFRSLYEWSKHHGEIAVQQYQQANKLDVSILRPAIIVGSVNSNVMNQSAYYQVCIAIDLVRKRLQKRMGTHFDGDINVRLAGRPEAYLNFVPIDFVVDAMLHVAQNESLVNNELKIFNIVNEDPPNIGQIHNALCKTLNISGLKLVSSDTFDKEPMSPLERALARGVAFQAPYMVEDITFSTEKFRQAVPVELLPPPTIDEPFLLEINRRFFAQLQKERQNGR